MLTGLQAFLRLNNIAVHVYFPFFGGHLGYLHLLATVNNAAIMIYKYVFESLLFLLLSIILRVELLDHMVPLHLPFFFFFGCACGM